MWGDCVRLWWGDCVRLWWGDCVSEDGTGNERKSIQNLKHSQMKAGPIDEVYIAIVLREILRGLDYLHSEGKLHRDIKGMPRGDVYSLEMGGVSSSSWEMGGGSSFSLEMGGVSSSSWEMGGVSSSSWEMVGVSLSKMGVSLSKM